MRGESSRHLFVIVRIDESDELADWKQAFKLLQVFDDRDVADGEVRRLRSINGPSKCTYEIHTAHSALKTGP